MNFYIIIPAHNEAEFISKTLQSLVQQTYLPKKIVVVNDHSTDKTGEIVRQFAKKYSFILLVEESLATSSNAHIPGSKVIQAFEQGLNELDNSYDVLCKFDADLVFPKNYLEILKKQFKKNQKLGICGGFCTIQKDDTWKVESLTDKNHVRGALKAYRKDCFLAIGGLKKAMGWDTVDELLARYHHWEVRTIPTLNVQHLRPTGKTYNPASRYKQGEAFYRLRYGFLISCIASVKLALLKGKFLLVNDYLQGFYRAKKASVSYLVSEEEGKWIRRYRWQQMRKKLF